MFTSRLHHLIILIATVIFTVSGSVLAQPNEQDSTTQPAATPTATTIPHTDSSVVTDSIHWNTFEQGVKASQESGKPLFLFCYGSWCGYSQKMLARTFHDTTVIQYLNAYFTPVMIETQSKRVTTFHDTTMTEAQVASKEFGVRAVPSMWLLEPDGCRIKKIKGYYPAKYLLPELQAVHDHTYGDCQNVPLTDPPPPSQPAESKQNGK